MYLDIIGVFDCLTC